MKVQILSISVATKTSAKGKNFQNAEVAFKNFDNGKVESKNITEYSKVFKQVVETQAGQHLDVFTEKNENGFWEWTSFKRIHPDALGQVGAGVPGSPAQAVDVAGAVKQAKSQYETPEERAKKQVYIVKQSSLSTAVALLSVGQKTPPKTEDVIAVAQELSDFVFGADPAPEAQNLGDDPLPF